MNQPEDALAQAERHVREFEQRVARKVAIVEAMDRDNHPEAAALAMEVLATLQWTLDLARDHLRIERAAHGRACHAPPPLAGHNGAGVAPPTTGEPPVTTSESRRKVSC